MRASRLLSSWLVAAVLWTVGARTALPSPATSADNGSAHATEARLSTGDVFAGSPAFLAATPLAQVAGAEDAGRAPTAQLRLHRIARPAAPPPAQAARIAALAVTRLSFARDLDAARQGWFSFGSTAPPPFHG